MFFKVFLDNIHMDYKELNAANIRLNYDHLYYGKAGNGLIVFPDCTVHKEIHNEAESGNKLYIILDIGKYAYNI